MLAPTVPPDSFGGFSTAERTYTKQTGTTLFTIAGKTDPCPRDEIFCTGIPIYTVSLRKKRFRTARQQGCTVQIHKPTEMEVRTLKVAFYTLGCKLNFSETATIARQFEEGGYVRAAKGERADICVINTCSVTEHADKKCRHVVRRAVRENPGALVAVTGCYAQLRPQDLAAIEGVDIVVGNNEKGSLYAQVAAMLGRGERRLEVHTCAAEEIRSFFAAFSTGDRTRAFLKVQDGCNYRCSYCTIPDARGASRNIPAAELVGEAEQIAARGVKEIVLTGVNIGDFGRTTGESFLQLVTALDAVEGVERYRISSIEPNLLTDEVIAFCAASEKFVPHFHIPLQSGSDRILRRMRRRYDTGRFAERIARVREAMPDAFLGIDVIVGFPGETEDDFADAYRFLAETIRPAYLHIFPYSVRPGTPAAEFPQQVAPETAAERVARLGRLSAELHAEFCARFTGQVRPVLFESTMRGGRMTGFTDNYIRVAVPYRREWVNRIVPVELGMPASAVPEASGYAGGDEFLTGRILAE